ncbi:amidase domain-containing protein [Umezawaea endophytica]|uniref:Amidase domain-containing protein n=1 Tax=Umezawaea endophytica TaxID=1654476 RepID=A0A9X2VJF8_9PSEU|nr:amidase domain-containing protein [Umezawaea endophytica]MCS7477723.1 amidase domain-containing protein [Umezawaea endophytica]
MFSRRRTRVFLPFIATATLLTTLTSPAIAEDAVPLSASQAHDLVSRYLEDRAFRVTKEADRAGSNAALTAVPLTADMKQRLDVQSHDLDSVRDYTARGPVRGYVGFDVDVAIDRITAAKPTEVDVQATEVTKLFFGHGDPRAPQFEGYRLQHDFTFIKVNDTWTLGNANPHLKTGPPPPTQAGAPKNPSGTVRVEEKSTPLPPAGVTTARQARAVPNADKSGTFGKNASITPYAYNYQAMWDYAIRWFQKPYNSWYREFPNDCTNFISQIMAAGGWQQTSGFASDNSKWWYDIHTQTYSWAGAHNWGLFAQVYSHRTSPLDYVYQMLQTDVLQVDWDHPDEQPGEEEGNIDHTMFVNAILGEPGAAEEVFLAYHTTDRWNVAFWSTLLPQTEPRDVWYAHRT